VIVSSEKRDESLQDISQSVTALTEQELEIKHNRLCRFERYSSRCYRCKK
jgi:hypothetical protein